MKKKKVSKKIIGESAYNKVKISKALGPITTEEVKSMRSLISQHFGQKISAEKVE